ncbi:DUF5675 family protein [Pantoea sp. FN0302]|uniref:DUF5675 family protein n=1 Tax=Pantoea sp. FN0302 TaxID=3418558 RepID=UPI003CF4BF4E
MTYTIFVQRKWQTTLSTISEFSIPGTDIRGYFLECPGPDTITADLKKRIPEGSYSLVWHTSNKFSKHSPLPQLYNAQVPLSRWILIHPGNEPSDTEGCLLPGRVKLFDRVEVSKTVYDRIKSFMLSKGINNFKVIITSHYVDGNR